MLQLLQALSFTELMCGAGVWRCGGAETAGLRLGCCCGRVKDFSRIVKHIYFIPAERERRRWSRGFQQCQTQLEQNEVRE